MNCCEDIVEDKFKVLHAEFIGKILSDCKEFKKELDIFNRNFGDLSSILDFRSKGSSDAMDGVMVTLAKSDRVDKKI